MKVFMSYHGWEVISQYGCGFASTQKAKELCFWLNFALETKAKSQVHEIAKNGKSFLVPCIKIQVYLGLKKAHHTPSSKFGNNLMGSLQPYMLCTKVLIFIGQPLQHCTQLLAQVALYVHFKIPHSFHPKTPTQRTFIIVANTFSTSSLKKFVVQTCLQSLCMSWLK